jgi:hypothetical protein
VTWDRIHRRWAPLLWAGLGTIASCATSPRLAPLPALPPPLDLGSLVPPAPGPLQVPKGTRRYEEVAIRAGQCGVGMPPGILVSPAVYAEQLATASEAKRLRLEVAALERVRITERRAAADLKQACRARAAELEEQIESARRLSTVRAAALVVAGGLIGLLTGFAISKPIVR